MFLFLWLQYLNALFVQYVYRDTAQVKVDDDETSCVPPSNQEGSITVPMYFFQCKALKKGNSKLKIEIKLEDEKKITVHEIEIYGKQKSLIRNKKLEKINKLILGLCIQRYIQRYLGCNDNKTVLSVLITLSFGEFRS